jgi:spermidine/putrescine-binding protein
MEEAELAQAPNELVDGYVSGTITRRQFVRGLVALGFSLGSISAVLAACAAPASTPGASTEPSTGSGSTPAPSSAQLSVLGWGGRWIDALDKWVNKPFSEQFGVEIVYQEQVAAGDSLAKLQAEQKDPTIDVWLTTETLPLQLAKGGGLAELTGNAIPNLNDIFPSSNQLYQDKIYGAGIHLGAKLIGVDRDRIKALIPDYSIDMLKTWDFLYRPELKDQIVVQRFDTDGAMVGMSKVKGGSEFDEEKFFAAMKTLAPNVHVQAAGNDWAQLFQSEEVVAGNPSQSVARGLLDAHVPVDLVYPADPLITTLDYVVAVKNGPAGEELAKEYINFLLSPDVMTGYCAQLGVYSPNRKVTQPKLEGMPAMSLDQLNSAWSIDAEQAIATFDDWSARWDREIVPLFGG